MVVGSVDCVVGGEPGMDSEVVVVPGEVVAVVAVMVVVVVAVLEVVVVGAVVVLVVAASPMVNSNTPLVTSPSLDIASYLRRYWPPVVCGFIEKRALRSATSSVVPEISPKGPVSVTETSVTGKSNSRVTSSTGPATVSPDPGSLLTT